MPFPPTPHATAWYELRDAAPLEVWLDAARQIVNRHGLPDGEASLFPTGSDVVMRVGDAVVKLSQPTWAAEIQAEADLLGRVAGRVPVATPHVLAQGELSGWPYVVMSFVPGQPLGAVWPTLDRGARLQLAVEIGELLAALGAVPVPPEQVQVWEDFLAQRLSDATKRLSGARVPISEAWSARIAPFLASTPRSALPLAWMHTELMGDHLLVTERQGRWGLSAVLDFADGRVGHPFYELPAVAEFLFKGEPGLLGALLGAWGVPLERTGPALSRELGAWGLIHRFGSVSRALAAAGPPEPPDFEALAERLYPM